MILFLLRLFAGWIGWRIEYTDEQHERVLADIRAQAAERDLCPCGEGPEDGCYCTYGERVNFGMPDER